MQKVKMHTIYTNDIDQENDASAAADVAYTACYAGVVGRMHCIGYKFSFGALFLILICTFTSHVHLLFFWELASSSMKY